MSGFILEAIKAATVNVAALKQIQSFVSTNYDTLAAVYFQYEMFFYTESKSTDSTYIKQVREKYRYKLLEDEKPICSYKWSTGKFLGVFYDYGLSAFNNIKYNAH